MHANSPREVPARLEALAALGGLGREALHAQLAAAFQVIFEVHRWPTGRRHLRSIGLVERGADGYVRVRSAWTCDGGAGPVHAELLALLAERGTR